MKKLDEKIEELLLNKKCLFCHNNGKMKPANITGYKDDHHLAYCTICKVVIFIEDEL